MRTLALRDVRSPTSAFDKEVFRALLHLHNDVRDTPHEPMVLDVLISETIPVIGEALSGYSTAIDEMVQDEMVQISAIAVMDAIRNGRVDVDRNFHSYLRQLCRWRMLTVLQKDGPQEFDLAGRNVWFFNWSATLPGQAEVEMRLFLEQLQRLAVQEVSYQCRFRGQQYDACIYIAEQLIAGKEADVDRLRAQGFEDPRSFVDYVRVIMRNFLWDFHQRHSPMFPEDIWSQETWVAAFFAV